MSKYDRWRSAYPGENIEGESSNTRQERLAEEGQVRDRGYWDRMAGKCSTDNPFGQSARDYAGHWQDGWQQADDEIGEAVVTRVEIELDIVVTMSDGMGVAA